MNSHLTSRFWSKLSLFGGGLSIFFQDASVALLVITMSVPNISILQLLHVVSLLFVAGCGGGDEEPTSETPVDMGLLPRFYVPGLLTDSGAFLGMKAVFDAAYLGSLSDFVTSRLTTVRNETAFRANVLSYPNFGTVRPLQASRLDWVRSIDRVDNANRSIFVPDGKPDLTGEGVVLGIIDSAILATHEQFASQPDKFLAGGVLTRDQAEQHGTGVASVMAGTGYSACTGVGCPVVPAIVGYAPGAQIWAGQLCFDGSPCATPFSYTTVAGYILGAQEDGAVAVNNSWSVVNSSGKDMTVASTNPSDVGNGFTDFLQAVTQFTADGGGVIVFSQNNSAPNDGVFQPSASFLAGLPAELPELEKGWLSVINLAATFDVASDQITSVQRISEPCLETARWCIAATGYIVTASNTSVQGYTVQSGTSFAAPQVTGALGLLAQAFPDLTPGQLRARLLATADNSWFSPSDYSGFLTLAPGVEHGYSNEFGHGFLNVRDALLPIGAVQTATASGQAIQLSEVAVSGGSLSGDALERNLAAVSVGYNDQMGGSFATPLSSFVALPQVSLVPTVRNESLVGQGRLFGNRDFASVNNLQTVPFGENDRDWNTAALLGQETTGLSVQHMWGQGSIAWDVRLSAARSERSLFGMEFSGDPDAAAVSASIGVEAGLGEESAVSATVEFGLTKPNHSGVVSDVSTVAFAGAGLSLEQRGVMTSGDRVSWFVQTPLSVVDGDVTFATQRPNYSSGGAAVPAASGPPPLQTTTVSMVPDARELEIGLEYAADLRDGQALLVGLSHRLNAGHISGNTDQVLALGYSWKF